MGTRGAGCELLKLPLERETRGEDESRVAGRGARPGHSFPPACFGYWGLHQACPARPPVLGAGPGPAAGPLLARQPCLLRPGGAGTFAGRGSVPFPGGVWGGRSCAASWETGRSLPALPSRDARPAGLRRRPGFVPLPRPRWPPRGSQPFAALRAEPAKDGGGGECASHRLL